MYECEHYTDSIYYLMEQTAKYCRGLGVQMFEKLNMPMSIDEFVTLDVIMIHGAICQRDLAKLILKDRPNTGRILNSLEKKHYIERFADTKNNRLVRRMRLTPDGKKITEETSKVIKEYIAKIPKIFSNEDKQMLINLIKKFRKSIEQEVEVNI